MTLWTAAEAARATGGTTNTDWTASGVSIDSRSLQSGDLFIALNAARDGHEFVADALANDPSVTSRPIDAFESALAGTRQQLKGAVDRFGDALTAEEPKAAVKGRAGQPALVEQIREGPP